MPDEKSVAGHSPALPETVSCPKLGSHLTGYRYYAGYSRAFVRDILINWPQSELILDPWNGSGATTTVSAELGRQCLGIDMNPAMVVIARAALLTDDDAAAIQRQACKLKCLSEGNGAVKDDDPLLEWIEPETVARVRSIQATLVGSDRLDPQDVPNLEAPQAFWLTALFDSLRQLTTAWRSSNPTWVKQRGNSQPASLAWEELTKSAHNAAASARPVNPGGAVPSRVVLGDSTDLRNLRIRPSLVLGSPPYCTRIDYAIATRIELSALGLPAREQTTLRRRLLGTTTVPRQEPTLATAAGHTAHRTLEAVRNHPSKASATYYVKWLAQYLDTYTSSLRELSRVTTRPGTIGLVLQGSYYKETFIDLPKITTEILGNLGWNLIRTYAFQPRRSLANINPRAIAYRDGSTPHERALFFRSEPH